MGLSHSNCTGVCGSSVTHSQYMGLSNCTEVCGSSVTHSQYMGLSNCTEACVLSDSVTAYGARSQKLYRGMCPVRAGHSTLGQVTVIVQGPVCLV